MIRSSHRRFLASLGLALMLAAANLPFANAANSGGNALRVSPVRTDVTINPGEHHTVTVYITNVGNVAAHLQAIINDFTASNDESGNPAIILDPTKFASSHSLKRLITPVPNFTLNGGQTKGIDVVINVPKNAVAGGYFGAVRFAPASTTKGQNQNVSLSGSVGSLILLKVPGDIKENVTIVSFDARKNDSPNTIFFSNKGITANVRFRNAGNIQEEPFGKILLKNRSGKVLASYEINNETPPGEVLPDSIRKFTAHLKKVGSFGEFKIEGNFGYGSSGQLLSGSTTFYVIPVWLILAVLGVIALVLFLVFGLPKLVKAYNDRVLRKAGK
ncbi:MAG TPA: hypothetical protein VG604_01620 [Candidatus Saccharimonadales bacterium]|nr:hypothetical protein [Candidatus Saccharimonadales bacterium]